MRAELATKSEVWRGRGQPRRVIPDQVRDLADRTYKSSKVAVVDYTADEVNDIAELMRLLRSYAKQRGWRCRIQPRTLPDTPTDGRIMFEMADRPARKETT